MCQSYYGHNFEMLMLLAGFVKADTPGSVKLKILENILERYFDEGNCAEEFKTNLVGLSVSEVKKASAFTRIIQFHQTNSCVAGNGKAAENVLASC